MAARKRKVQLTDSWKDGIRVSMLMGRLYGHALGENDMSQSQIKAAQIVLAKLVPDLNRAEHTGKDGGPMETITRIELVDMDGDGSD
jgi:hypothetical protein